MLAILYSFRRCPYAIRARMALCQAQISVELREVVLKNKPPSMLEYSSKGTVPVLVIRNKVIDESLDVMRWALGQNDPKNWLGQNSEVNIIADLIDQSDKEFKPLLDAYKYSDRYPESELTYFEKCKVFLNHWDQLLMDNHFLIGKQPCLADVAIFPFVRQFAFVNKPNFDELPYKYLQKWLSYWLDSKEFLSIMPKFKAWEDGDRVIFEPFKELGV